jgi:hypothetical protein
MRDGQFEVSAMIEDPQRFNILLATALEDIQK